MWLRWPSGSGMGGWGLGADAEGGVKIGGGTLMKHTGDPRGIQGDPRGIRWGSAGDPPTTWRIRTEKEASGSSFRGIRSRPRRSFIILKRVEGDREVGQVSRHLQVLEIYALPASPTGAPGAARHAPARRGAPRHAARWRAVARRAVPHRAMPRRSVPRHTAPCRAAPQRAAPRRAAPWHATPLGAGPHHSALHHAVPHRGTPCCTELRRAPPSGSIFLPADQPVKKLS